MSQSSRSKSPRIRNGRVADRVIYRLDRINQGERFVKRSRKGEERDESHGIRANVVILRVSNGRTFRVHGTAIIADRQVQASLTLYPCIFITQSGTWIRGRSRLDHPFPLPRSFHTWKLSLTLSQVTREIVKITRATRERRIFRFLSLKHAANRI